MTPRSSSRATATRVEREFGARDRVREGARLRDRLARPPASPGPPTESGAARVRFAGLISRRRMQHPLLPQPPPCPRARRWCLRPPRRAPGRGGGAFPRDPACDNGAHAHERADPRGAEGRDRPRAPARHRRARDGPIDRDQGRRGRRRHRLADDPRLPDQEPLPDRRHRRRAGRRRRRRASTSASTSSPTRRRPACSASSAARAGCPRARWPRSPTSSASAPARAASASPR